jgi:AraC family transcriptional regulator, regulatory protein of adaptative response / methylated-DNA-[protein]-cysteine methyltransferase
MSKSLSEPASPRQFVSDADRLRAFRSRNRAADGKFIVAVKTTGIYCRPVCPARPPKVENILFFDSIAEARSAGFRACKRCLPDGLSLQTQVEEIVKRADRLASKEEGPVKVATLARISGLSEARLARLFKSSLGLTPKQFLLARATQKFENNLRGGKSVTHAILDSGFASFSRAYVAGRRLGVRPGDVRSGGEELVIRVGVRRCSLGFLAIGLSERGLCALTFGDTADDALEAVRSHHPKAQIIRDDSDMEKELRETEKAVSESASFLNLPLDIRGTVFQEKVWKALTKIPRGETRSYAEVARAIGHPKGYRAVAQACGANKIAVLIPCHRVIGSNGDAGGYAYGVPRKRALLKKERAGS